MKKLHFGNAIFAGQNTGIKRNVRSVKLGIRKMERLLR